MLHVPAQFAYRPTTEGFHYMHCRGLGNRDHTSSIKLSPPLSSYIHHSRMSQEGICQDEEEMENLYPTLRVSPRRIKNYLILLSLQNLGSLEFTFPKIPLQQGTSLGSTTERHHTIHIWKVKENHSHFAMAAADQCVGKR